MEVIKNIILIIEDNAGLNELLSEKVQDCGYQTYSVYSAVQAFEWLEENNAFLILLDFSLPDMNGKEFIEWLQSDNIPLPPFIVASGQGDERIAVQMMKLGARDYVVKDSDFLELMPLIISKVSSEIKNEQKLQLTESELAESNKFNKQIIKSAQEGIVVYDLELKYLVWNPFMERLTGVQSKDVLGKYVFDVFPFLEKTQMSENLELALKGNRNSEIEFYFSISETGKSGWVSETYAPLRNAENQVIGVIAAVHDITERKKSEQALRESEELYRNLVERLPDGVYKSTPEGKFVEINPAIIKMLGYDNKEEMMAIDIKTDLYFDMADRESLIQNEFNQPLDAYLLKKKDGTGVWVEDNGWYTTDENGNIIAHEGVLRDISERKKAEFVIQENRNMLHKLLITSSELIDTSSNTKDYERITEIARELSGAKYACFNIFDEKGRYFETVAFSGLTGFQQKALDLFGFEIINKKWDYDPVREASLKDNTITEFDSLEALAHNFLPKFVYNKIKQTYKIGKVAVVKITKNNRNIGDFTLLLNEGDSIRNPEILELFTNQVGLFIERQISEEKLRKNEEKFRILFAENPQPMFVYDVETLEILEVNKTALNFYGYTKEECLSMSVKVLHPLEELPIFLKMIEQTRAGINTDGISNHIKKNGEKIMVEVFTVPATSIGPNVRHVLVVDITERKLAEEALNHKMQELMRFHHLTVGREHSMIELKREINHLLVRFGEMEKYKIVE